MKFPVPDEHIYLKFITFKFKCLTIYLHVLDLFPIRAKPFAKFCFLFFEIFRGNRLEQKIIRRNPSKQKVEPVTITVSICSKSKKCHTKNLVRLSLIFFSVNAWCKNIKMLPSYLGKSDLLKKIGKP